jgi:predicted anti-sigma-YlaC factor YlaD
MTCDELNDLAPEVALGTIEGEERAEALRHLATCGECRRLVDQLTKVADELLMLAPVQEPPVGFESRVSDALGLQRRPPRRRLARRLLVWLGPPLAAAAVTAAALVGVYHDDRVTAERYRTTLEQANGKYFQAEPLRDGTGAEAGVAFGYQGSPSWMLVTVDPGHRAQVATAELVTRDQRTIRLPGFELEPDGSWGGAIPVHLYDVSAIRLLGERPGEVLEASTRPR